MDVALAHRLRHSPSISRVSWLRSLARGGKRAISRFIGDESGNTLAETLVALTLFSGVLIPLLTSIGSLIMDDRADRIHEALNLAQMELTLPEVQEAREGDAVRTARWLRVERRVTVHGTLAEIDVLVIDIRKGGRPVVHLAKTVVAQNKVRTR